MGFWPVVLNVLRNSDVVLLLVDARMPEVGRNSEIVNKIKEGKKLIYVFNKIDLVSKKDIEELRWEYPDGFFVSSTKRTGVQKLKRFLEELASRKGSLHREACFAETGGKSYSRGGSLRVGIVGYPNIGKSTLMNLLAPGARAKVSRVSGTTRKTQWVRVGRLRIMDSPGVIPFGDSGTRAGVMSGKDAHKIKNPEKVAIRIIEFLIKKDVGILRRCYGVDGDDAYDVFGAIGRKKGYLVKGGVVDENRTAIKVIDDWQKGRINFR